MILSGAFARSSARPADDIILGILVEITLVKWRRIERIKKLRYFAKPHFDYGVFFCLVWQNSQPRMQ